MTTAAPAMALREDQIRRYARHVLLPDVGGLGQERLLAAAVAVHAGSAAAVAAIAYLAAAGVGRIAILGGGTVTANDVATGILYGAADVGRPRIDAIRERVAGINSDVDIVEATAGAVAMKVDAADGVAEALWVGGSAAARVLARIARR